MGALRNKLNHGLTPANYILLQEFGPVVFRNPIRVNYTMATSDII